MGIYQASVVIPKHKQSKEETKDDQHVTEKYSPLSLPRTELYQRARHQGFHSVLGEAGDGAVGVAGQDRPEEVQDGDAGKPMLSLFWFCFISLV